MMHLFLADPENAKAYQVLCDHPRGSTRAWATKAGWTHSRMRTFLANLIELKLASVEKLPHGSFFEPVSTCAKSCEVVSPCATPYLASSAVKELDEVPRYGETPKKETATATPDAARLIDALNIALVEKFGDSFEPIDLENFGSIRGAAKILAQVPLERAIPLIEQAARLFTPDKTGGDLPRSLGHPFITKYVINEFRRTERDLVQGQLSLLFVERTGPPTHVYGASKLTTPNQSDAPAATPETIAATLDEFRRTASGDQPPPRRQ